MGTILNRRRAMGGKSEGLNYIQDGLIAWYDGEWNTGIGVHNSSSTLWKNLANNLEEITGIDSNFEWGDKYLFLPNIQNVGTIPSYKPVTTEIVVSFSQTSGFVGCIAFGMKYSWFTIRANDTINFLNGGYYAPILRNGIQSISGIGVTNGSNASTNPTNIFVNGIDKMVRSGGATFQDAPINTFNFWGNYGSGRTQIYCLRVYNRSLTENEVLHNYEIDKKRFNI